MYLDKEPRIIQRPRWQLDIRDPVSILPPTKVEPLLVEENLSSEKLAVFEVTNKIFENKNLWCAEQVWDELLHVGRGLAAREAPCVLQRVEGSVGKVEVAVLMRDSVNLFKIVFFLSIHL